MRLPPGLLLPFDQMTVEELRDACAHWSVEQDRVDEIMSDLRKLQKAVKALRGMAIVPREMRAAAATWLAQREAEDLAMRARRLDELSALEKDARETFGAENDR